MILKTRKSKHVSFIRDHIFYLHRKLTNSTANLHELEGKKLNEKVKELQSVTSRMTEYQKYLKLLLY